MLKGLCIMRSRVQRRTPVAHQFALLGFTTGLRSKTNLLAILKCQEIPHISFNYEEVINYF